MKVLESIFGCCILTPNELDKIIKYCKVYNRNTILEINCGNGLNSLLIYWYSRFCQYPLNVISTCYFDKEFNSFYKWCSIENIKAEDAIVKYNNLDCAIFSSWPRYNFLRKTLKLSSVNSLFFFVGEKKKNGDVCFKKDEFPNIKIIDEHCVKINLVNIKTSSVFCTCFKQKI